MTRLLLTVGNEMMGDDGAGALLAQRVRAAPLDGWVCLHGGSLPEARLHQVRELAPGRVLIVDAAEMGLPTGQVRRLAAAQLAEALAADPFLLTSHALPLGFLVEALQEFVPQVELVGIQPGTVAFGLPLSEAVRTAVDWVYAQLHSGAEDFIDL
ncbi:MAG: hydrogenase maturation peptidase HycI [Chloroflexota bacterium]